MSVNSTLNIYGTQIINSHCTGLFLAWCLEDLGRKLFIKQEEMAWWSVFTCLQLPVLKTTETHKGHFHILLFQLHFFFFRQFPLWDATAVNLPPCISPSPVTPALCMASFHKCSKCPYQISTLLKSGIYTGLILSQQHWYFVSVLQYVTQWIVIVGLFLF